MKEMDVKVRMSLGQKLGVIGMVLGAIGMTMAAIALAGSVL